ncbi:mCG1035261, partial [Mus musculus]
TLHQDKYRAALEIAGSLGPRGLRRPESGGPRRGSGQLAVPAGLRARPPPTPRTSASLRELMLRFLTGQGQRAIDCSCLLPK